MTPEIRIYHYNFWQTLYALKLALFMLFIVVFDLIVGVHELPTFLIVVFIVFSTLPIWTISTGFICYFDKKAQIIIQPKGLFIQNLHIDFIPWEAFLSYHSFDYEHKTYIRLYLHSDIKLIPFPNHKNIFTRRLIPKVETFPNNTIQAFIFIQFLNINKIKLFELLGELSKEGQTETEREKIILEYYYKLNFKGSYK